MSETKESCETCGDDICKAKQLHTKDKLPEGTDFCQFWQPIANSCENCYSRQVDRDGVCLLEIKCNKRNNFKFWQSEEVPADNPDKVGYEKCFMETNLEQYGINEACKVAVMDMIKKSIEHGRELALKEVEERVKDIHLIIESDTAKETWIKQSEVLQAIDQLLNKGGVNEQIKRQSL